MKENCLDIGLIQAFMDGELSHDQIVLVSDHLERCDSCAFMLASAEEESAFMFSALDREFNTLVPTQRLWTRINESIEVQRGSRPFWEKALAFLSTAFARPSFITATGLAVTLGVLSLLLINREPAATDIVMAPQNTAAPARAEQTAEPEMPAPAVVLPPADRPTHSRSTVQRAVYRTRSAPPAGTAPELRVRNGVLVEGEESYIKTISSLARTVDEQKQAVLGPSERIAYERDMALVNDTIAKMRREVRRNPRNEGAKQVLYSSYQNKIDLLNSVSQKEELVASLD